MHYLKKLKLAGVCLHLFFDPGYFLVLHMYCIMFYQWSVSVIYHLESMVIYFCYRKSA